MNEAADSRFWETTVTQLIHDFRDAILALTPVMDRQLIPWVQPGIYDDYDDLERTLFKVFVLNSVEHALDRFDLKLHPLRFSKLDDWSQVSFVSIEPADDGASHVLAFNGFADNDPVRSAVWTYELDGESHGIEGPTVPLEGSVFVFQERKPDGTLTPHRGLRVPL